MKDRTVVARDPASPSSPVHRSNAPADRPRASRSADEVDWLHSLVARVAARPSAADDAERIDRIVAIDALIAALAAAQIEETAAFCASQLDTQRVAGVSRRRLGAGISEQVALARKMSPASGRRYVATARTLCGSMPHTLAAMRAGAVSEWVASLVVRETACLETADRRAIDCELAGRLATMSARQAEQAARRRSYQIDPVATMARSRTARGDRRVSLRPAPDTMAVLTGFLPVEQGVAAWANLDRHAKSLRAAGDPRSLGQIMADTLVERLTGQATASAVPVEVGLTISIDTLTGLDDVAAVLPGRAPIPAPLARALALGDGDPDAADAVRADVFLRRLITDPVDGTVIGVDTRRRRFDRAVARFIVARDQVCRTPYCGAPIRHLDHITARRDAGPTSTTNGRGVCASDNYAREAPGWAVRHVPGRAHRTVITTPTGHRYSSTAPPALGP